MFMRKTQRMGRNVSQNVNSNDFSDGIIEHFVQIPACVYYVQFNTYIFHN